MKKQNKIQKLESKFLTLVLIGMFSFMMMHSFTNQSSIKNFGSNDIPLVAALHLPFSIDGNNPTDWISDVISTGTGDPATPYIIENLEIDSDGSSNRGIYIKNTNEYLIIRNCIIRGQAQFDNGLFLSNVSNVVIENVNVSNTIENGISLTDTANINITKNYVKNCQEGLWIMQSNQIIINNSFFEFSQESAIFIMSSSLCQISNNNITSTQSTGVGTIFVRDSNTSDIFQNKIYDNNGNGINLMESNQTNVHHNIISYNGNHGLTNWYGCMNNNVSNNTFKKNLGTSIDDSGIGTIIQDNIIINYPIASFTASTLKVEPYEQVNFIDTSIEGVGPFSYFWQFDYSEDSSIEQNPSYIYHNEGTHEVMLTITDADGDQSSFTLTVTSQFINTNGIWQDLEIEKQIVDCIEDATIYFSVDINVTQEGQIKLTFGSESEIGLLGYSYDTSFDYYYITEFDEDLEVESEYIANLNLDEISIDVMGGIDEISLYQFDGSEFKLVDPTKYDIDTEKNIMTIRYISGEVTFAIGKKIGIDDPEDPFAAIPSFPLIFLTSIMGISILGLLAQKSKKFS